MGTRQTCSAVRAGSSNNRQDGIIVNDIHVGNRICHFYRLLHDADGINPQITFSQLFRSLNGVQDGFRNSVRRPAFTYEPCDKIVGAS